MAERYFMISYDMIYPVIRVWAHPNGLYTPAGATNLTVLVPITILEVLTHQDDIFAMRYILQNANFHAG